MLVKKIVTTVFNIFNCHCNNVLGVLNSIFKLFVPKNKILLTSIEKKPKKIETENVRKQLKTTQNILIILWCISNANINIE